MHFIGSRHVTPCFGVCWHVVPCANEVIFCHHFCESSKWLRDLGRPVDISTAPRCRICSSSRLSLKQTVKACFENGCRTEDSWIIDRCWALRYSGQISGQTEITSNWSRPTSVLWSCSLAQYWIVVQLTIRWKLVACFYQPYGFKVVRSYYCFCGRNEVYQEFLRYM